MKPIKMTLEQRFKRHIQQEGYCHLWTASTRADNVPVLSGRSARRIAWELHFGVKAPHFLRPTCGKANCVNPSHLAILVPQAKLTREQVDAIRAKYSNRGSTKATVRSIADEFDTTFQNVAYIVSGKTWKDPA